MVRTVSDGDISIDDQEALESLEDGARYTILFVDTRPSTRFDLEQFAADLAEAVVVFQTGYELSLLLVLQKKGMSPLNDIDPEDDDHDTCLFLLSNAMRIAYPYYCGLVVCREVNRPAALVEAVALTTGVGWPEITDMREV